MTSNITDASQDELIRLIYHHLKENGYQKAAHVLRKLAPQVETEEVKVSLSEIFQKWASSDDGEIPPVPSGVQTPEIQSPAKSKITAPSAGPNTKQLLGKKETGNKPRKRKVSSSEDLLPLPSVAAAPGNDSDSDSSLDVDKWRKLISEISDADREKMDVLSILDESSGNIVKERKPRKPRKKKESQEKKEKSDSPTKKATDESSDVSLTAKASKTRSRKPKGKDVEVSKDKTPSKNTEKDSSVSGLDVVETPKTTKAKTTSNSFDQDETNKAEEHHETNTPLERTKRFGVLDSDAVMTPKRVHFHEADINFAQQVEASACENNGTSETSTDAPAKKAKKKKRQAEARDVETDNSPSNIQVSVETHCEETNLTTDQSETPSKKVKSKKYKSVVDPVPNETPSKKDKAKKTDASSEIDQDPGTSESVNPDSSKKANASLSETAFKVVKDHGEVETPNENPKTITSDADLLQSDPTNSSLKRRKRKVVADAVEIQQEMEVESNASQALTQDDGLGNELESSSQEAKTHKKRKRKLFGNAVEIQQEMAVESNASQQQTEDDGLGNELESSSQEAKTHKKRKRKLFGNAMEIQQEMAVESNASQQQAQDDGLGNELESSSQEAKTLKRKKHKREEACDVPDTANEEGENALQSPPPEEEEEETPVEMSQKKKKKKKEKERGEQTEEMVPDEAPVEEAVVHKKKKKSSKENRLSCDEGHGLIST